MIIFFVSCGESTKQPTLIPTEGNTTTPTISGELTDADLFEGLDFNMSASLDVMVWSGDGQYYEDLGKMDIAPADMTGQNVAAIYAVAKEFNKIFPNVKINLYSKPNDPHGGGVSWSEELEAFKAEHQKYPDVWASANVATDINKGLCLDLTEFSETHYYKMMNTSLLNLTNYYGFQGALPQYILPWGVYVNRELAENNNIKTPDPDWSWAQYTKFVSSAKPADGVYGSWDSGMQLVRWATVEEQIQNNSVENGYIDITTTEFKNAVKFSSQGQQRTLILALKLAELEMLQEKTGEPPILLLDDVLAELDDLRQNFLLKSIENGTQTILTSVDTLLFEEEFLKEVQLIRVESGAIV